MTALCKETDPARSTESLKETRLDSHLQELPAPLSSVKREVRTGAKKLRQARPQRK